MNLQVLIVDDSLTVRMDLAHAFEAAGFRPVLCASLGEARTALAQSPVDVAVLDVILPDGDGTDLLGELRDTPVLMLSTETAVADRLRGLRRGADEYVGKPYDSGYVIAKARELVRARQAPATPGRTTVLVVDDSVTVRKELAAALEAEGYTVIAAENGERGLRAAADFRPDAVIVDGALPDIDGSTLIRRIRLDAALRGMACILQTATDGAGMELQALDAGADAFVPKGDGTLVLAKLAAVLRSSADTRTGDTNSLLDPKRLLVVDDDRVHARETLAALHGEGYDVIPVHSADEALALLATQPVDCIVLDIRTPGPGGPAVCQLIRGAPHTQDVPVIMSTPIDNQSAVVDGLAAGADDVLHVSTGIDVLKARIRSQLRRKQVRDEGRRTRDELQRRQIADAEARAARELAQTRAVLVEQLQRANEELEAFSYSVSHDLRGPLQSIVGFSQLILEEPGGVDPENLGYLRLILGAAQRMGELIDDLLQLAQVGHGELSLSTVDLSGLATTILTELAQRQPDRRVDTVVEAGLRVRADGRLVRVLLENLLGNAWKYTGKAGSPRIEFGATEGTDATVYFVRDNGAGFEMSQAEKLFRPFTRLHSPTEFPGTGIGLATARRIVDRHGGRIWAQASVGNGATFSFTLP
jgi:DNA-binding response OmpR family regulator